MFTVRVAVRTRSGRRDAFVAHLKKEEEQVPVQFDGCERYAVYTDPADPDRALLYEEWTTREAFEAYRRSPNFDASGAVLFPLIDGAPDSAYYESELVGP